MEKLIFILDDEPSILKLLAHWVKNTWNYNVETFENAESMLREFDKRPDLILLDIMLPDINGNEVLAIIKQKNKLLPIIMLSAQGNINVALESLRLGAYDYFTKPIDKERLEHVIANAVKTYDLEKEIIRLNEKLSERYSFDSIISKNESMQEVFRMVTKVLDNDVTVLIHGESGTGKELIARAIHYNGVRKSNAFIVVNCASIPRELLESELFGHEKGAFTGAHQRKIGKFELADGGTIFLDEIGEMEMSLQAKILRVIQQREFERVGGNELLKADVRIISATNKDLKEAVVNKEFREDLFYRLSSFPINIPPLRERRSDIVILINHFVDVFNKKLNKKISGVSKNALKMMFDYDWPGNVRELENSIERCIILSDGDKIEMDSLPPQIKSQTPYTEIKVSGDVFSENSPIIPFEKLKEEAIKHAIKVANGNMVEASKKLRIGRATLYRLIEKHRINIPKN